MRRRPTILISVRSPHVDRLLAGSKSVELRRRWAVPAGTLALVYAAGERRELVGSFVVGESTRGAPESVWQEVSGQVALDRRDYDRYFDGAEEAVAIPVECMRSFAEPLSLDELRDRSPAFRVPQSHRYVAAEELRQILNGEYRDLVGGR